VGSKEWRREGRGEGERREEREDEVRGGEREEEINLKSKKHNTYSSNKLSTHRWRTPPRP
jgi:hypothetical protein